MRKIRIRKGVIAVAGWGTRFLPAVKEYAKQLVPILEKPVIQIVVEEVLGAGIDQIAIVHRHGDTSLRRFFTPNPKLDKYLKQSGKEKCLESLRMIWKKVKILKFIPQARHLPYGSASPILAAKSFIGKDPFVYLFGDDVILEKKPGAYLSHLISVFQKYQPAVVLGAQKVPWSEINRYGSIKYVKDKRYPYRAVAVLEKLPADQAPSNFAQIGRFVVSQKIFAVLAKQKLSLNNELWFADANNTLAKKEVVIAEPTRDEKWMTTGDPLNLLKANIEFGLQNEAVAKELRRFLKDL